MSKINKTIKLLRELFDNNDLSTPEKHNAAMRIADEIWKLESAKEILNKYNGQI